MANRVLEFLLQTKKQGDAVAEATRESKELADTLRNKVTLAMSEADQASRKLAAAQEKLAASSDPEEQAKLTHEINKARVAMDNAQAKADKYSDELNGVGLASKEAGDAQSGMGLSLTDLKSGLDLVTQGAEVLGQVFDATVGKAAQWGDDMGDLAQVTGQSVEATSQMAASLELLGIQSDKLGPILKTMTKQGLQLNMDTLIQLSREYQRIQDPVKQNEFLFKNFGRAAEDMAEVMGKSQEELLLFGEAARTSGKVIGEEAAAQAEQLNIQMAILQQKAEGAAIAVGNVLVPAVLDFIDTNDKAKGSMLAAYGIVQQNTTATETQIYALGEYTAGLKDADLSIQNVTDTTDKGTEQLQANAEAVQKLSGYMGGAVGNELKSFAEKQTELKDKAEEYKLKIEELQEKPYLTAAQKQELEDTKTKLGDVNTALEENATAHEIATKRILFSILQQQAASDGFTTTEVAGLTDIATKWGLVDEATANATKEMSGALEDLSNGGSLDDFNADVDTTLGKLLGWPTDLTTTFNFVSNGSIPNPGAGDIGLPGGDSGVYNPTPGQEITPVGGAYALGGSTVLPGSGSTDQPYLIRATPGEHVQFTPPGQAPSGGGGGGDIHIHIGSVNTSNQNDVDMLLQKLGATVRQAMQGGHAFVGVR